MSNSIEAQVRNESGKGAARALRRDGRVPGVIYGASKPEVKVSLSTKDVTQAYLRGGFFSKLVTLKVGKDEIQALPRDVQLHPVTDVVEHVDFQRVAKDQKINVRIPVNYVNAEKSPGVKRGGILNIIRRDIEVHCLPAAIPGTIEVDLGNLQIGHSVHINDVKLPEGAAPVIDRNFTLATIVGRAEEKETPVAAAAAAPAAGAAAPAAGAAAPAAGAAKAAPAKK